MDPSALASELVRSLRFLRLEASVCFRFLWCFFLFPPLKAGPGDEKGFILALDEDIDTVY